MLTQQRKTVKESSAASNVYKRQVVETAATLYQKSCDQFHVVLHEPPLQQLDLATSRLLQKYEQNVSKSGNYRNESGRNLLKNN